MDKENLKTVLFGYDRKTVDIFLKKLHRMQEEELEELRRKVSKAGQDRERLLSELKRLEEKQKDVLDDELMEAARNSVNDTLKHLKQQEEEEGASPFVPESAAIQSGKAIDFYDAAARRARKLSLLREVPIPIRPPDIVSESIEASEAEIQTAEESIPMQVDVETIGREITTEKVESKLTDVEQTISEHQPQPVTETNLESYRWVPGASSRQVQHTGSGFWDDADTFLEPIGGELLLVPQEEFTVAENTAAPPSESRKQPELTQLPPQQQETQSILRNAASETAATAEMPAAVERPSSPEIDALKRSYIVGKLAGEDLLDRHGHLIVARNTEITEVTVKLAEQEGKLAELIVNMIIPGLED